MLILNVALGAAQENLNELLEELDLVIENKDSFQRNKEARISNIKHELESTGEGNLAERILLFEKLSREYLNFDFDSAMFYTGKLLQMAYRSEDVKHISKTKILLSHIYISSGLFIEAKDTLSSLPGPTIEDSLKADYHYLFARVFFDVIEYYERPHYLEKYKSLGIQHLDSAISYTDKGSIKYYSLSGLKELKTDNFLLAADNFVKLFEEHEYSGHQLAVDASTYAVVLNCLGLFDEEIKWVIKSAIEDIKIANKETVALRILANKLFEQGNINKAHEYLNVAQDDAKSYGAYQREYQIAQIKPIVDAARLDTIVRQKKRIQFYAALLLFFILVLIISWSILFIQFRKIRKTRDELTGMNSMLRKINKELEEVNIIKEEYIGFFFETNTRFIDKLDFYRQGIENRLRLNRFEELGKLITNKTIRLERETLYRNFDTAFLRIFPSFIEKYNELFKEEDRTINNGSKELNTELRIFALIRLGIKDADKIASILNYSVNTINTYKTKIKNHSVVPNEEFEIRILSIQAKNSADI